MTDKRKETFEKLVDGLVSKSISDFDDRWDQVEIDLYKSETFEVIGGLLSRQATLLIEMASSPSIWNGNIAPLILRSMTDLHITLAWILNDPDERSKKYILYGLGQEKLLIEHYKVSLEEQDDPDVKKMVEIKEAWLESQRREFMTEVNVGNWAHLDTRKMAQEADCESLYKFAYTPFSMAAHNMWNHISWYNMTPCTNPLHKNHKRPAILEIPIDMDFLYRATKYYEKTLRYFDDKMNIKVKSKYPLEWWEEQFNNMPEIEENG